MMYHRLFLTLSILLVFVLDTVMAADEAFFSGEKLRLLMSLGSLFVGDVVLDAAAVDGSANSNNPFGNHAGGAEHRDRTRNQVHRIFHQYGPLYARRAYRMNIQSFWRLHLG